MHHWRDLPCTCRALPSPTRHRYDFATTHPAAKGAFCYIDFFMFGFEPLALLLWWGDLRGMHAGLANMLDAHAQVLQRVRQGEISAEMCADVEFALS
eukprot:92301-Prymnesium_polylepis.2